MGYALTSFLHTCFGRCERCCEDDTEKCHKALRDSTNEKKNLRAGERISENGKDALAHKARECCTEHHTEKCRHIRDDRVEGEIVRSVFIG